MNATAPKMTSPVEDFVAEVLDPPRMAELSRELPAHIKPVLFQRSLFNAVMSNPDLMKFTPGLVFREVAKAVSLGLMLDPQLGEAYIVTAYNYKTRQTEPQLRVGYRGLTKLARQSGDVTLIYAHEVCAKDVFECSLGSEKTIIHKPNVFGDRGDIVGYYAVMKLTNGEFDFEPMSSVQVRAIRDRTDVWKAFTEGKIKSTPWSTDESEMGKKTVIRRLMKRASQSPELAEAIRLEDSAEFGAGMARPRALPPSPPTMLQRPAPEPAQGRPAPRLPPAPPPPPKAATPPPPPTQSPGAMDFDGLRAALRAATDQAAADATFDRLVTQRAKFMSEDELTECDGILREACEPFWAPEE